MDSTHQFGRGGAANDSAFRVDVAYYRVLWHLTANATQPEWDVFNGRFQDSG